MDACCTAIMGLLTAGLMNPSLACFVFRAVLSYKSYLPRLKSPTNPGLKSEFPSPSPMPTTAMSNELRLPGFEISFPSPRLS